MSRLPANLKDEHDRWMKRRTVRYREYTITPVSFQFQPYYIAGKSYYWGLNVCDKSGCINMSPGAVWFHTVADAKRAIDCIHQAGGHGRHWQDNAWVKQYWELMGYGKQGAA